MGKTGTLAGGDEVSGEHRRAGGNEEQEEAGEKVLLCHYDMMRTRCREKTGELERKRSKRIGWLEGTRRRGNTGELEGTRRRGKQESWRERGAGEHCGAGGKEEQEETGCEGASLSL